MGLSTVLPNFIDNLRCNCYVISNNERNLSPATSCMQQTVEGAVDPVEEWYRWSETVF